MPEQPIIFGPNQESGYSELAGASPVAINCVTDKKGAVYRRPGVADSALVTSDVVDSRGIVGLYRALNGVTLAVGGSGRTGAASLYRVTSTAATKYANDFFMQDRATFAETEAIIAIAGDITPKRANLTSPYALAQLGGTPPRGTQVIAHGSRLLINDPDVNGRVWYSAPAAGSSTAGHEQWIAGITALGTSGFFTAEARPDPVVAMRENTNEVFVFGRDNTQVFAPDATFVYAPVSTKEYGCAAAASVIRDDQSFAWIDQYRRIVYSDGRSFTPISGPVKATLDNLTSVSDCVGFRVVQGPVDALVWVFPTDGIALAFQKEGGWAQWLGWDAATNNFDAFGVSAAHFDSATNTTLVGTTAGKVQKLDRTVSTDNGVAVPFRVTTGFISHGTDARKLCESIRFTLKRGHVGATEDVAYIEYRDDLGPWTTPRPIGLGTTGDSQIVVQLSGLGTYRRREWRFSYYGTADLVLASATETFTVLGY